MSENLREEAREELKIFERFSKSTCEQIIKSWDSEPKHETVEERNCDMCFYMPISRTCPSCDNSNSGFKVWYSEVNENPEEV